MGNNITAELIYFIQSCFQILTHTMSVLFPLGIAQTAELAASNKRIGKVLKALEVEKTEKSDNPTIKPQIIFNKVSVEFKDTEILHDLDLKIDMGLTLVTGAVGSGKSFLLKTILRDYEPRCGNMISQGRMSYASQEPWLFPSSIKQNILFGTNYDEKRYQEVLNVCALRYDLDLLPDGDRTIVEDRGINLSKGQQARINLARAVYKESDIYLLDDCLSALDAHVSDFIFEECVKKFLKNKLVLLVTHNTNHIKDVDNIILLSHGIVKSFVKSSEVNEKEIISTIEEEHEKKALDDDIIDEEEEETEKTALITEQASPRKVYQEVKKTGNVDFSVYKKYINFGGGFFAFLAVFLTFSLAQFVMSYTDKLVSQWYNFLFNNMKLKEFFRVNLEQQIANYNIRNITNTSEQDILTSKRDYSVNLYSVMIILTGILAIGRSFALFAVARKASINLHKYMITNIFNASMPFFDTNFIGNILNRFSKDLTTIDEIIPFVIYQVFRVSRRIVNIEEKSIFL